MVLDYPKRWVIINRPDVLAGRDPGWQGFIALTMENLEQQEASPLKRCCAAAWANQASEQDPSFSGGGESKASGPPYR